MLRKVFSNLSTEELLGMSLVNKFWNYEARCILRDQKKCAAVIKGEQPCSRAKELNDMLRSMAVIPFNGLDVTITKIHDCDLELCNGKIEEIYESVLKMPLNYLEFHWRKCGRREYTDRCLLGHVLLTLMATSLTLEHLHIWDIPRTVRLEQEDGKEQFHLPKLKTVTLWDPDRKNSLYDDDDNDEEEFWVDLLRIICDRAPNLEELKSVVDLPWIQYVAIKKVQILKNIRLPSRWPENGEILRLLSNFCKEGPKLHTFCAELPEGPTHGLRMGDYWKLVFDLLCRSSGTLQKVVLDHRTVFMLRRFAQRMQPLVNVTSLEIYMPGRAESGISQFLLPVPLGQIFPAVQAVRVFWGSCADTAAEFVCRKTFPWPAVTKVKIESYELRNESVRQLAMLFPNIRSLSLPYCDDYKTGHSFRAIWSWLPLLEHLRLGIFLRGWYDENFDAEFCGIYEAEAALLRKKGDTYLKTVNIVPPFHPIHYLRGKMDIL